MKAVTLRGIPPEVERVIRRKADESGASVNRVVIDLLEEAVGAGKRRKKILHHDLDALAGAWSREEAARFARALAAERKIDPGLWERS